MNYRPGVSLAALFLVMLLSAALFTYWLELAFLAFYVFPIATLLSNLPPKDLFERCAELPVDRAAWKDFFTRYNGDIEATVRRIIGYPGQGRYGNLCDDIMQRFYQRLLENNRRALHALRGISEGQARAYLRTIAAGVAYKMIGSEPPVSLSLENSEADGDGAHQIKSTILRDHTSWSEEALVLSTSLHSGLARILRGRNKYRNMLIFKLITLDSFTPKEISLLTCLRMRSRHAVEQLISRTRQRLRADFKK